jgi:hypothetical protein
LPDIALQDQAPATGENMEDQRFRLENIYGKAPVQADGFIDDKPFYFRARGTRWSFAVAATPDDEPGDINSSAEGFYREGIFDKHGEYSASYMPQEEAEAIMRQCAEQWMQEHPSRL